MRFETLSQWLSWLESFNVIRSKENAFAEVTEVAKRLNLFPYHKPIITVTGTNGKGSCAALLETVFAHAGYKTAAFTSPHLLLFNERIRVQGKNSTDELICCVFSRIDKARRDIELSYFQFAFLAALLIFQESEIDLAIFEAGIGGRRDIVNILSPELTIITNIELDHCYLLGETREKIAVEKAGIMREGIPAVCGDLNPPGILLAEAKRLKVPFYCLGRDFFYDECLAEKWKWHCGSEHLSELPKPKIMLQNAAVVLAVVNCLKAKFSVSQQAICEGLTDVFLQGRQQEGTKNGISVLLDVAHNPAAAKILRDKIRSMQIKGKKYAIVGIRRDKDIAGILNQLSAEIDEWFVTGLTVENSKRETENLCAELEKQGIESRRCYFQALDALQAAFKKAKPGDLLIVFGSFLTVSSVLKESSFLTLSPSFPLSTPNLRLNPLSFK